ncbi:MAG: HEAT repeat domain-containing protein [Planctomycetota bacterium]|jgi:hypothetical protein
MKMRILSLALLLCGLGCISAWADTILLKNGAVFEGEIFEEDEKQIGLRIKFGGEGDAASYIEKFFPRDRIKRVTRGGRRLTTPTKPMNLIAKKRAPRPTSEEPKDDNKDLFPEDISEEERKELFEGDEEKGEDIEQPRIDPALADQLEEYIKDLGNAQKDVQARARERIGAIGPDASPLLIKALGKAIQTQRTMLIRTLGDLGDKRTTQTLIGELKGGVTQKERTAAAHSALERTTGKSFPFTPTGSKKLRTDQREKWAAWFEVAKNLNTYKHQFDNTGKLILVATTEEK